MRVRRKRAWSKPWPGPGFDCTFHDLLVPLAGPAPGSSRENELQDIVHVDGKVAHATTTFDGDALLGDTRGPVASEGSDASGDGLRSAPRGRP
jgi:hypothetical protein